MNKSIRNLVLSWGCVLLALGWGAKEAQRIPAAFSAMTYAPTLDTVTYADKRIVYTVDVDTATNEAGQLRYILDLAAAPAGARMEILMKSNFDSAMIITGDTFDLAQTDSATALARATAWGVADPFTVALAWHILVPDPVTNLALVMVFDTLKSTWTESADDYRITGGLNSGPSEDYTDTVVTVSQNLQQVATFGSYWTCVETLDAGVLSDNRCGNVVYVDTTVANDSFPNEPSSYILVSSRAYDDYLEDGWSNNGTGFFDVPHIDAGALTSPSNVGRVRFNAGRTGGTGPFSGSRSFTSQATLYVSMTVKLSSNWQGHSSGVNKLLFIVADDYGGGGDPVYLSAQGTDANALNLQVRMQGPGDEGREATGSNITANLSSATLTRGEWYHIEVLLVANTASNFDGEVHVWVNDVKTHEYTDVLHFDQSADASAHKWNKVRYNPIWGGVGDEVSSTMYQYLDHLRISGP